ncbi:MAG: class I tRNA ligase family protein, partial [Candidatus Saccharimonadales bacterium]
SWPYATLGFPDGEDFKSFYPLSLMESGFDLLFPWISRMIMLGLYVTREIPFKDVYLHGMITDGQGRKMSKSVGNVIDPMDTIDSFGSDALRIGVISGQTAGNNQPFVEAKVIGGRNFINKLWNIARFIEGSLDSFALPEPKPETAADHWILDRFTKTRTDYLKQMDGYRYSEAYETVYHFIWDDLADWYIEASKITPNKPLLAALLKGSLSLIHPFAPFVSETIWQTLELDEDATLISQELINLPEGDEKQSAQFGRIKELVIEIRSVLKATGSANVKLYYRGEPTVAEFAQLINSLSGTKNVEEGEPGQGIALSSSGFNCWLDIDQASIDRYLSRLEEQIAAQQLRTKQLKGRLNNADYVKLAPKELVDESRAQLVDAEQSFEALLDEKLRFSPKS